MTESPAYNPHLRKVKIAFRILAIGLGVLHYWVNRHAMNPDGVSYLDIADAYLRHDWQMAVNAMWSPLYSWLLASALFLLKPSPYWEFPVVHLVNLIIYLFALVCFEFFWRELVRLYQARAARKAEGECSLLPEWALVALGYVLFIWSSVFLMKVMLGKVTPDVLMAAFVYLASGILLRLCRGKTGWLSFILLGLVLGLGYLAKAPMFPLAFIFLIVSLFLVGNLIKAAPRVFLALVVFLSVSLPFVVAISRAKGRLTFGDSGRVNYAWKVDDASVYWQGEPEGMGAPKHPMRKLMDVPAIYEYGSPITSTYPLHYDPSYWMEGVTPHLEIRPQIEVLLTSLRTCYATLFDIHGSLVIGLFILFCMSRRGRLIARDLSEYWFLYVPALAALTMYSLVHVEQRYLAPFIVLIFAGLFLSVRLPDTEASKKLAACVMLSIVGVFLIYIAPSTARAAYSAARDVVKGESSRPNVQWQVAEGLKGMRVQSGESVALIIADDPYKSSIWARSDKLRIIAEIPTEDVRNFWAADVAVKKEVMQRLARAGARWVVANNVPVWASSEGWQKIDGTDYYIYSLQE